jgi:hypothetical protein
VIAADPAEDYIAGNGFWNRAGQANAAIAHDKIQFPAPAVEYKADRIQTSSMVDPKPKSVSARTAPTSRRAGPA